MAFLVPLASAIAGAAFAVGLPISAGLAMAGAAALVGFGAKAVYDYVLDTMIEDIAVDTMGGRNVTKKDPTASRKMVYGTVKTGGTIVYQANSGDDNEYLHNIVVFCEGTVDEISEIYFDDVKVYGTHPIADGYYYYNKYSTNPEAATADGNKVEIILKKGLYGAGAFAVQNDELPSQWGSNHVLSKLCYAYIRLEYSDEIYTNGFPKITAIIKGKRLYDPRQDSTATAYSGSGSQRIDNPSTWEYTNNSAVCLLNYMLDDRIGLGESLDAFDATSLLASMDDCDVDISLSGGGTQKKYTCDGIIDSKNSHKANIQNILTSMNGQLLYSGGKYHVKSYNYETPHSQVVTEDMIIGNIDIATKASRRSLYNRVKGKFVSEEDNYVMTEYPAQIYYTAGTTTKQFEIDDGETLYHEYNLPMTTNNVRAQRLARLTMLRSRMQSTIKFTTNAKGLLYTVGDNIKVTNSTLGITEKVYQIQRLNVRPDAEKGLTVSIEAKENVEDFYNWSTTDELTFTSGLTVSLFDGAVSAPTNLKLESYYENNKSKIRAEWTASSTQGDIIYKVFYRNNSSAKYRAIQQPNTYENFIEIDVKDEYQQAPMVVIVQAMRQASGVVSDSLSGVVTAAKIDKVNPNNIVRGTIANPTVHELSLLAFEAGINLNDGEDITYLQELNGEIVNSFEFQFEQVQLSTRTLKVNNNVIGRTFTELVDNGDFTGTSGWTLAGNSMNITNGKLELSYTGEIGVAYQLDVIAVGKKYNVSFDLSDLTNTQENRFLFVVYDFFRQELLLEIDLHEAGAGTYTDSFIGSTDTIIFGFINISQTGQSVSVDNISILREPEKAEHKVLVSLPEDVTSTVTWSYSPTTFTDANSIGIENVSGVDVTLTPTGTDLVVNGRQSKELELTRNYDSVGFSQCEITVTASWNQVLIIAGIEQTIPKEISTTVLLSARVT
jgi:hypothetical protein